MEAALLYISTLAAASDPAALDLDSSYYRYEPVPYDTTLDTAGTAPAVDSAATAATTLWISGAKDFSFDVKQGFDQGLRVNIAGEVEGVKVEGNLSDKAAPSSTVRLSEVERISLRVATSNFNGGLGNLTLALPFGITDEIQGGLVGVHTADQKDRLSAAYAVNRGDHRRRQFAGEEGKQSPYFMEGPVIPGSERVYITYGLAPPALLERDRDYKIDYTSGILSFTNRQIITNHTRIEVEYEAALEDYINTYQQFNGATAVGPVEITGLYRATADDQNDPLTFTLSPAETESLILAGDHGVVQHTYADTSSEGSYVLENEHFVYVGPGNGDYNVAFFYIGEGEGDYVYEPLASAFVFLGPGLGNYSPTRPVPLPRREEFFAFGSDLFKTLAFEVYGSRVDQNTFSPLDDTDNGGYGYRVNVNRAIGPATVNAEYLRYGDRFETPARREDIDHQYVWNTPDTLSELASVSVGLAPTAAMQLDLGYGLLNRQHKRRFVTLRPYFFSFGYEAIDTATRYFAGFNKQWRRFMVNGRYERYGTVHIFRYGTEISVAEGVRIGLNGSADQDRTSSGMTNAFDLTTSPLSLSLGHRSVNDTTFYFGNAGLRLSLHGLSLLGEAQQTQRYSQKRDDAYVQVDEGTGDYVYDPVTGTYIAKEGGDYVRRVYLLPDFTRVVTRDYAVEAGYERGPYTLRGRFYYLDEEELRSHSQDVSVSQSGPDHDVTLWFRQEMNEDRRYAVATNSVLGRSIGLTPAVGAFSGQAEMEHSLERTGDYAAERRNTYRAEVAYEILDRPLLRPKAGYAYSIITSDYYEGLDIRQQAPRAGVLLSMPLAGIKGKIETTAEVVYRRYNVPDVPYLFAANEPDGTTTTLGASVSFGVGANTVFSLVYRIGFRPDQDPDQNMRLQSRIKF